MVHDLERELRDLLQGTDLSGKEADVSALIEGIAAAPPSPQGAGSWLPLLGAPLPAEVERALAGVVARLRQAPAGSGPDLADRLRRLRAELRRRGLDGFAVPRADEHQGEYVAGRAERLAWISGFTGSAGLAVILAEAAGIFVDGRYTLQVRAQAPAALFAYRHLVEDPLEDWLRDTLPQGGRLGYDPWLHTVAWVERQTKALAPLGISLVPTEGNPIDSIWADQPPPPLGPVVAHDLAYAGEAAADKRQALGARLAAAGCDVAVLTTPDAIAWLLNIRGADVPHNPVALSFALLHGDGHVDLFIDRRKLSPGLERHLGNAVALHRPADLGPVLDGLAGRAVGYDPAACAVWIAERLRRAGAKLVPGADPCALPRARKNAVELAGARAAHRRDGAAMTRFLHWLDGRAAAEPPLTESAAAERLAGFRAEDPLFRDISFDTIAGAGPNGAIVHYRVTAETDRAVEPGGLLLLDSGGQYLDGTTDTTRTIAIGRPGDEMRQRFTRVLKGHIALATARFPKGTTGSQLDTLARQFLWQAGLDYDHGTGHGVGSFLSVHEGPHRISKIPNSIALEPGMIVSNEPGYYKTGAYGIRIENLLAVTEVAIEGAERPMLGFETLTLCPIDLRLVEPALLSPAEAAWLDGYHARVAAELAPLLAGPEAAWLSAATAPLGR